LDGPIAERMPGGAGDFRTPAIRRRSPALPGTPGGRTRSMPFQVEELEKVFVNVIMGGDLR